VLLEKICGTSIENLPVLMRQDAGGKGFIHIGFPIINLVES
jgi:hypothetical protein